MEDSKTTGPEASPDTASYRSDANPNADRIVFMKQMRVYLDAGLQKMKSTAPSRNLALAITELEYSIMRLGMELKDIGTPNPYPNSYKPENTIVEPTADGLKM